MSYGFEFRRIFFLVSIVSDNGLAPVRRQAIIWITGGLVNWRTWASPGPDTAIVFDTSQDIESVLSKISDLH